MFSCIVSGPLYFRSIDPFWAGQGACAWSSSQWQAKIFLWLMVKKSKDQDQRVFDITCTEWDMEHFVKATSTKFWHQDPGKTCSKINRYTNYAHLHVLIHNALNALTPLTNTPNPNNLPNHCLQSYNLQLQTETALTFSPTEGIYGINYFQNPSRLHYVCMLSLYKIIVNNNHGLN